MRLRDAGRQVTVRVGIREKEIQRILRNVPVRLRGGAPGARLKPESIDVKVSGPATLVNALDRGNLLAEIRLSGLAPREKEYRIVPHVTLVGLPPGSSGAIVVEPPSRSVAVWLGPRPSERP